MNHIKPNINDVKKHLTEVCHKLDDARDYVRVTTELINSCIEIQAFDKVPLELRTALDLLSKIDWDLEYFETSLAEDKEILDGNRDESPISYEAYKEINQDAEKYDEE